MNKDYIINAESRSLTGKGAARRLRQQGIIPAIFYGPKREAQSLTVNRTELTRLITSGAGGQLINLSVADGETTQKSMVMLKDYQVDPLKRVLIHADFLEVDVTKAIEVEVPLELIGKPIGLEKGGILQQVRHTIEVSCLPAAIPSFIEVDISHLDFGETLHASEITAPEGVEILAEDHLAVATVVAPKGLEAEEAEEGEEDEEAEAEAEEGE